MPCRLMSRMVLRTGLVMYVPPACNCRCDLRRRYHRDLKTPRYPSPVAPLAQSFHYRMRQPRRVALSPG